MDRQLPLITVLMPVRNEEAHIRGAVQSVLTNGYPLESLELIAIDGQSDDRTRDILVEMRQVSSITVLDNPARIVPTAMNIGLAQAKGEIIFRLDGHAKYLPGYIQRVVSFLLAHPEVACAGGALRTMGENAVGKAITAAQTSPFGVGDSRFRLAGYTGEVDTVAFGGYRREVFERIGGFDEELVRNQDDELNHRLRKAGMKVWMLGDITSIYVARGSYAKLWRQYFQYGFWKIRTMQKLGHVPTIRSVVPGVFAFSLLFSFLIMPVVHWPLFALTICYSLFLILGWFHGKMQSIVLRTQKLFAIAIMHFSYGMGFWAGVLRFMFGWKKIKIQTSLSR